MGMENLPSKLHAGLKAWAKGRKTSTIAGHLEGKVDDPQALAATIRRDALGAKVFAQHQKKARQGKGCG